MNERLKHYLVAALWTSTNEDGEPLDSEYSISDFAPEAIQRAESDLDSFKLLEQEILQIEDWDNVPSEEQMGHDIWLTRNGHGAGFWDRGLGKLGDLLTKKADSLGECEVYVGDDGQLHFF